MQYLWRVRLFGGLRVEGAGTTISHFRSRKTAALLAYLALRRDRSHPRDLLADLLWPESSLHSARHSLSQALSSLRKQLEPPGVTPRSVLLSTAQHIGLNPEVVATDVADFEEAIAAWEQTSGTDQERERLERAVALYQGELMGGDCEAWMVAEQERLSELYFLALHRLIGLVAADGDLGRAIRYACEGVAADPAREETHQALMGLYLAAGRPSAAARQFRQLERLLESRLQMRPSAKSRELARQALEAQQTLGGAAALPDGQPAETRPS